MKYLDQMVKSDRLPIKTEKYINQMRIVTRVVVTIREEEWIPET